MRRRSFFALIVICWPGCRRSRRRAGEPTGRSLEDRFADVVKPFLGEYCAGVPRRAEEGSEARSERLYVGRRGREGSPGLGAGARAARGGGDAARGGDRGSPKPHERRAVIAWIARAPRREARRNAGDPGPVLARRLSNAEYDYTIRDLTGVDIRPTREFPVDPANEAGFDNSGESLTMSPALVKKYLAAARLVADHLVLKPDGFAFAPHPAVADTDRDKYCVRRIIDFYERHEVDYADYFLAAWRFQHRAALGKPQAHAGRLRRRGRAEPQVPGDDLVGPDRAGRRPARSRAAAGAVARAAGRPVEARPTARRGCERMRDLVVALRARRSRRDVKNLQRQRHLQRQPAARALEEPPAATGAYAACGIRRRTGKRARRPQPALGEAVLPASFPDAFFVSDRARVLRPEERRPSGRLLTAGFHLHAGLLPRRRAALRADPRRARAAASSTRSGTSSISSPRPRCGSTRTSSSSSAPSRRGSCRRPEFDFARSEDKDATSEAKMTRLRRGLPGEGPQERGERRGARGDRDLFRDDRPREIRRVEQARLAAEPRHLEALAGVRRAGLSPAAVAGRARRPAGVLPHAPRARTG